MFKMLSIAVLFGVVALGQCICPSLESDKSSMNNCGDNGERMEGDFVEGADICEVRCLLPSGSARVRFVCASGIEKEEDDGLVDCAPAEEVTKEETDDDSCPPNDLPDSEVPNCFSRTLKRKSKIVGFAKLQHCPQRCYIRLGYGGAGFGGKRYSNKYYSCPSGYEFKIKNQRKFTYKCVQEDN